MDEEGITEPTMETAINKIEEVVKELEKLGFPQVLEKDSESEIERDLYNTWCNEKLTYEKLDNSSFAYDGKWSGEYPAMVAQTLFDKVFQAKDGDFFVTPTFVSFDKYNDAGKAASAAMATFIPFTPLVRLDVPYRIAMAILTNLYPFVLVFTTAKNFANLLSLILVMWLYVQAYINDSKGNIFQLYCKKIMTVFLTQFFIIALFYIASAQMNSALRNPNITNFFLLLALITITFKSSSLINEIVNVGNIGGLGILGKTKI
jgi:hypothetical protein